jgi:Flp pilus assembly protein TadG
MVMFVVFLLFVAALVGLGVWSNSESRVANIVAEASRPSATPAPSPEPSPPVAQ